MPSPEVTPYRAGSNLRRPTARNTTTLPRTWRHPCARPRRPSRAKLNSTIGHWLEKWETERELWDQEVVRASEDAPAQGVATEGIRYVSRSSVRQDEQR
jgi:hypothetical protein